MRNRNSKLGWLLSLLTLWAQAGFSEGQIPTGSPNDTDEGSELLLSGRMEIIYMLDVTNLA